NRVREQEMRVAEVVGDVAQLGETEEQKAVRREREAGAARAPRQDDAQCDQRTVDDDEAPVRHCLHEVTEVEPGGGFVIRLQQHEPGHHLPYTPMPYQQGLALQLDMITFTRKRCVSVGVTWTIGTSSVDTSES